MRFRTGPHSFQYKFQLLRTEQYTVDMPDSSRVILQQ